MTFRQFLIDHFTPHSTKVERRLEEMQAQLQHITDVLADVQTKTTTIVSQLNDAKTQITGLQQQLKDATANADDPAALKAISDSVDALDKTVNDALTTATAPPPEGGTTNT